MNIKLPDFIYKYDSFDPIISEEAIKIHYEKHHKKYVDNLNLVLKKEKIECSSVEELSDKMDLISEESENFFIDNLGGHINHTLFWDQLLPVSEKVSISDSFKKKIEKSFGSFENFEKEFEDKAKSLFGSGWVWLCYSSDEDRFCIKEYQNQYTPAFYNEIPVLGIDVWEHSYYIDYRNERGKYVSSFWNIVNWEVIDERWDQALELSKNIKDFSASLLENDALDKNDGDCIDE